MFPKDGWQEWYAGLVKPTWTPSGETIGLIWGALYPLIIVSYGATLFLIFKKKGSKKDAWPLLINIAANLAFTPILFGLKNIPLATLDIIVVWVTILLTLKITRKYSKVLALLQLPYLVWVSIASVLQFSIFVNNL